ncbi:MAG: arylesterase [Gammaproteobacteria bacterium]
MRLSIKGAFVLLLLAVAGPIPAQPPAPVILIIGDSLSAGFGIEISEGWVALLQDRLEQKGYEYRVVNASISGDTTGGGLRRLPRALERHQPAITLLELGGNDGLRATPVPVIRRNMERMIELSQAAGSQVILAGMQIPPNYGISYTTEFAEVYTELATERQVGLIPFFMDGVALQPELLLPDLIHPNTEGQPVLLENAWEALKPLLKNPTRSVEAATVMP